MSINNVENKQLDSYESIIDKHRDTIADLIVKNTELRILLRRAFFALYLVGGDELKMDIKRAINEHSAN